MRVSDVLKAKGQAVYMVAGQASLEVAVREMHAHAIGALLVLRGDGRPLGILSEREVTAALARHGARALRRSVAELISPEFATVAPDDCVQHAMQVMTDRRARHLPVVADGAVVGLLSIGDVVKSRLSEKLMEVAVLQDMARIRHAA